MFVVTRLPKLSNVLVDTVNSPQASNCRKSLRIVRAIFFHILLDVPAMKESDNIKNNIYLVHDIQI